MPLNIGTPGPRGNDGAAGAAGANGAAGMLYPGTTTSPLFGGRPYYYLGLISGSMGSFPTGTHILNTGHFVPFMVGRAVRLVELGCCVSVGNTCPLRIGLYDADALTQLPNTLLWGSDEIDASSSGLKAVTSLTIDLIPGVWYWTAFKLENSGSSPTFIRHLAAGMTMGPVGQHPASVGGGTSVPPFAAAKSSFGVGAFPASMSGFTGTSGVTPAVVGRFDEIS